MKTKYKFIRFELLPDLNEGKSSYVCYNNRSSDILGGIDWYPPWRCFVFTTHDDAMWSVECLADIQHFMGQLKEER